MVCVGGRECILCGAEFKKFSVRQNYAQGKEQGLGKVYQIEFYGCEMQGLHRYPKILWKHNQFVGTLARTT